MSKESVERYPESVVAKTVEPSAIASKSSNKSLYDSPQTLPKSEVDDYSDDYESVESSLTSSLWSSQEESYLTLMGTYEADYGSDSVYGSLDCELSVLSGAYAVDSVSETDQSVAQPTCTATKFNQPFQEVGKKPLGSGAYGTVWQAKIATDQEFTQFIAIKSVREDRIQFNYLLNDEINLHMMVQSEHVITLLGVDSVVHPSRVFMEFAAGGSLYNQLVEQKTELTLNTVLDYAYQATSALAYIHYKGIIHGDLHSGNVLVTEEGRLKLADFGCAIHEDMDVDKLAVHHSRFGGAPKSRAPELLKKISFITKSTDIYALGWVLWQLTSNQKVFPQVKDLDFKRVTALVVEQNARASFPQSTTRPIPKAYKNMTFFALHNNPVKRPQLDNMMTELVKMQECQHSGFAGK